MLFSILAATSVSIVLFVTDGQTGQATFPDSDALDSSSIVNTSDTDGTTKTDFEAIDWTAIAPDFFTETYVKEVNEGHHSSDFEPTDVARTFLVNLNASFKTSPLKILFTTDTEIIYKIQILDDNSELYIKLRSIYFTGSTLPVWYVSGYATRGDT
jgi:hypothetical protein